MLDIEILAERLDLLFGLGQPLLGLGKQRLYLRKNNREIESIEDRHPATTCQWRAIIPPHASQHGSDGPDLEHRLALLGLGAHFRQQPGLKETLLPLGPQLFLRCVLHTSRERRGGRGRAIEVVQGSGNCNDGGGG